MTDIMAPIHVRYHLFLWLFCPFLALAQSVRYDLQDHLTDEPITWAVGLAWQQGRSWPLDTVGTSSSFAVPPGLDSVCFSALGYESLRLDAALLAADSGRRRALGLSPLTYVLPDARVLASRGYDRQTLGWSGKRSAYQMGARLNGKYEWYGRRFEHPAPGHLVLLSEAFFKLGYLRTPCVCAVEVLVHELDSRGHASRLIYGPVLVLPEDLKSTLRVKLPDLPMPPLGVVLSIRGNYDHMKTKKDGACPYRSPIGPYLHCLSHDLSDKSRFVYDHRCKRLSQSDMREQYGRKGFINYKIGLKIKTYRD